MSYLKRRDLKNLTTNLKEYYGEAEVNAAMKELIEYYDKEAFDDEDITNDWIPNDCKNSHGIDKFVESLNYPKLYDTNSKNNLFEWFCHWLLDNVPRPNNPPVHPTTNKNTAGNLPINTDMSQDPIERVAHKLARQLKIQIDVFTLNAQIADNIAESFIKICKEDDYTELLELNSDFENMEDSFIVDEIMKKYPQYRHFKEKIFYMLQDIVIMLIYDNYPLFELRNFECKFNEDTFKRANKLCMHFIPCFFKNTVDFSDLTKSRKNLKIDNKDLELLNAKALDFQNNFPLLINLFDAYTRFRAEDNHTFWRTTAMTPKSDKQNTHRSVTLEPKIWWRDFCGFAKWFKPQNKFIHESFQYALTAINKRPLPQFNFNHVIDNTIFDSYEIFTRYVCAFNAFLHNFLRTENGTVPFQIDLWILPRLTKTGCNYKNPIAKDFNDVKMEFLLDDDELDDDTSMADLLAGKIQDLKKNDGTTGEKGKIWDLEENLRGQGGQDDYRLGEDYWCYPVKRDDSIKINITDTFEHNTLVRNFIRLWKLYTDYVETKKEDVSYRRFILVIDRRNPQHIRNRRMVDDTDKDQTWNDRMFLIRPKKYTLIVEKESSKKNKVYRDEICKLYRNVLNETFIGNTMEYLFPIPEFIKLDEQKNPEYRNDLTGLDSANGYKFVVSYHVYFYNKVKMYWYFGQGAMRFFVNDIYWLWPRYFSPKDDKDTPESFQELSRDGKFQMECAVNKYPLEDRQFNQFAEQLAAFNVSPMLPT